LRLLVNRRRITEVGFMLATILNIILEMKIHHIPIEVILVSATDIMELRKELKSAMGSPNVTQINGVRVLESPEVKRGAFHLVLKYGKEG
jgi:hypothetical protein